METGVLRGRNFENYPKDTRFLLQVQLISGFRRYVVGAAGKVEGANEEE